LYNRYFNQFHQDLTAKIIDISLPKAKLHRKNAKYTLVSARIQINKFYTRRECWGGKNSIKSYIKDRKGQADNKLKAEYYKVNENITADCKEWIFYLPNQVLSFGFF
jgi:hypothetical protein